MDPDEDFPEIKDNTPEVDDYVPPEEPTDPHADLEPGEFRFNGEVPLEEQELPPVDTVAVRMAAVQAAAQSTGTNDTSPITVVAKAKLLEHYILTGE